MDVAEPFAETLQPCGERRLVKRRLFAIASFACVVGHAFDTRDGSGKIAKAPPPQGRADHTDWVQASQDRHPCGKLLGVNMKFHLRGERDRLVLIGSERGGDSPSDVRRKRVLRFLRRLR